MESYLFEGSISVKAVLEGKRRDVACLYTDGRTPDRNRAYILRLAKEQGVPVETKTAEEISAMAKGKTHGGILALGGPRKNDTTESLFSDCSYVFYADGIEDPFNFGGTLRALYAAGATGLITRARNWGEAEPIITRASAGASEFLPVCPTENPKDLLLLAKEKGLKILAAERKDAVSIYQTDLTGPVLIIIGGELRGINKELLALCDQNVFLPYANGFRNALSAQTAATVFAFEGMRQRNAKE